MERGWGKGRAREGGQEKEGGPRAKGSLGKEVVSSHQT